MGRVWLEISLDKLKDNFEKISLAVAPCKVIAILKANAYGLGVRPIAEALAKAGACGFGVAELNEALQLKDIGLPVQIHESVLKEEVPEAVANGIIIPVFNYEIAEFISAEARRQGKTALCHFAIDTGMGRLGILSAEAVEVVKKIYGLPNLKFNGIYSHFPIAYQTGGEYTLRQVNTFTAIVEELRRDGISFEKVHIANSDAINNFTSITCRPPFTHVRTGINLYGSFDSAGQRILQLRPVLSLKTRLTSVREFPAGLSLGYGCTYTLPVPMKVGIISAGYADGLPLALSNRGHVLIRGKPCFILGRISMDYTAVSLEQVPYAQAGDEAVCIGGEGPTAISVESWAQLKGTHAYDIICSFGTRVRRCYL